MTQNEKTFNVIGKELLDILLFFFVLIITGKNKELIIIGIAVGERLLQDVGVIGHVTVGHNDANQVCFAGSQHATGCNKKQKLPIETWFLNYSTIHKNI